MDLIDDINTDHDRIWAQIGRLEAVRDESPRREGLGPGNPYSHPC